MDGGSKGQPGGVVMYGMLYIDSLPISNLCALDWTLATLTFCLDV